MQIFIFLILCFPTFLQNEETEGKTLISSKLDVSEGSLIANNDTEDYFPMYYVTDQDSAEIFAHSNRIMGCEDHSSAKNVCDRANSSSLCQEHEVYAYSFCRKSCRFCDEINNIKHFLWRVIPGMPFSPTWAVNELTFYSKYPIEDSVLTVSSTFSSSNYPGYESNLAFDNNNSTYWIPALWGNHESETEWIGANVSEQSKVNAIKLFIKNTDGVEFPKVLHIESSNSLDEPFTRRWTYHLKNDSETIMLKPSCPALWKTWVGNDTTYCIRVFWKHFSWEQANLDCKDKDSNLISFHEMDQLTHFIKKFLLRGPTWVGLNDKKKEGKYEWSDGSKVDFFNWAETELFNDIRNDNEDCVYIDEFGHFFTSVCHNTYFYACKKPYARYAEPTLDEREPEVISPIIFYPENYFKPVRNTSEAYDKFKKYYKQWPKIANVPITMDENTTYSNRTHKMPHNFKIIKEFKNSLFDMYKNYTNPSESKKEKEESPIHRYIQKRRKI